jgi:conjugal transfer pilus assembly protein TrbC
LIVRGLVNDSFLDTQKAVKQVIGDQQGGIIIDPRLFQQYHITQVPVVVIHPKNNHVCLQNQSCWHQENFDVVVGDVGLENSLKTIADRGDNTQTAQKLLAVWRST